MEAGGKPYGGTAMEYIPAKQILSRNRSTAWFGTDYTMNLYRGCCHGCIYCDSRSACYGIEDFGRVRAKENALALLRDELRRTRWLRKDILWALRSTSRVNRARSSARSAP